MRINPADDLFLARIEQYHRSESPDKSQLYHRGALSVITQILNKGYFDPEPVVGLVSLAKAGAVKGEERAEVDRFLREHGWTIEQGVEYAHGVQKAEGEFSRYARKRYDERER